MLFMTHRLSGLSTLNIHKIYVNAKYIYMTREKGLQNAGKFLFQYISGVVYFVSLSCNSLHSK